MSSRCRVLYHHVVSDVENAAAGGAAMHEGLNRLFYRETIQGSGVSDGKVVRQSGGIAVYAHVRVAVRSLNRGQGTVFAWNAGLSVPARFVPAVAQGVEDAMNAGELAGLQITDVHTSIEDGSYHDIDSTANSFREAAAKATREALRQAQPIILEAWALVTISVAEDLVVAVENAVLLHGGEINASPPEVTPSVLASVPASHANDLIAELLEISEGRASISTVIDGFRPRANPPDTIEQWVESR
jgi:elongation factor G